MSIHVNFQATVLLIHFHKPLLINLELQILYFENCFHFLLVSVRIRLFGNVLYAFSSSKTKLCILAHRLHCRGRQVVMSCHHDYIQPLGRALVR